MVFGLTDQGFNLKRLEDIKTEIEASLRASLGDGINLDPESPLGQMVGIMSERFSLLWELANGVYNSQYPDTAEGASLDDANALVAVARLDPVASNVVMRARGTPSTVIPAGSVVSVLGDTTARFATDADGTIAAVVNAEQTLTFDVAPDSGTFTITFAGQTTAAIQWNDVAATVETRLEDLSTITSVTVTGNFTTGFTIEFDGADAGAQKAAFTTASSLLDGANPVVITVTVLDEGGAYVDIDTTAESSGPTQAPADSLTVIETLVAGWTSVNNLDDAVEGRNLEEDEAYRLRRTESLQQSTASTTEAIKNELEELDDVLKALVVENDTNVVDGDGRPPKSFEAIVDGGDEQEIADQIFASKPAGIETVGVISKTVVDSEGDSHTVKFSRPSDIDIYWDITATEIGSTLTDQDVEDAILAYGDTLGIGDNVIVYPSAVAALNDLPISDLIMKVGVAPGPTLDNNIVIASDERAKMTRANISVTIV